MHKEWVGFGEGCQQMGIMRMREELVWFACELREVVVCQSDRDLREVLCLWDCALLGMEMGDYDVEECL